MVVFLTSRRRMVAGLLAACFLVALLGSTGPATADYISDFALADLDGDGKMEIVAAVVQKLASTFNPGQSQIYIFSLGKASQDVEQQ